MYKKELGERERLLLNREDYFEMKENKRFGRVISNNSSKHPSEHS